MEMRLDFQIIGPSILRTIVLGDGVRTAPTIQICCTERDYEDLESVLDLCSVRVMQLRDFSSLFGQFRLY